MEVCILFPSGMDLSSHSVKIPIYWKSIIFFSLQNIERELVTPPLNGLILPGIVRDSVLHLTRQWGNYKVSEKVITMEQILKLHKDGRVSIFLYSFCVEWKEIESVMILLNFLSFLSFYVQLLEMFGTGTACVVSPIERIQYMGSDIMVPTLEQEKPLYGRILDTLTAIQYGKIDHPWAVTIDWKQWREREEKNSNKIKNHR